MTKSYESDRISSQEIEQGLLSGLLQLGQELLRGVFEGKSALLSEKSRENKSLMNLENKGKKERKYLSIFGMIEIERSLYWSPSKGSYYELDEALKLPKKQWSYNLQEWVGETASSSNFEESVELLNKILGLNLSGKSSQRNARNLGCYVEPYYENLAKEKEATAVCFSASFDGKGVPKIVEQQAIKGNPKKRLGPGEKQGKKQMATVSVSSSFEPRSRTKASVLGSLVGLKKNSNTEESRSKKENENRWHKKIHRRAFLDNQSQAIRYGLDDIRLRMVNPLSRFVVPIDGGIGLENKVLSYVKEYGMEEQFDGIIIDIIHVSEYVWDVGTALFGAKSVLRTDWVRDLLEDLLDSKVELVLLDLKRIRKKGTLTTSQAKQLDKIIRYLKNHGHNMDYKYFIEKGYPISSALVESTCGHLVKDRMEDSGMRWSSEGAQNIMDLRAVKINGNMTDFIQFVITQQRKTLLHSAA